MRHGASSNPGSDECWERKLSGVAAAEAAFDNRHELLLPAVVTHIALQRSGDARPLDFVQLLQVPGYESIARQT